MRQSPPHYSQGPEPLIVSLAAQGDRDALEELVRRRQSWLRGLFRRFSGNATLADDLSQRVFLKMWRRIRSLKEPTKFPGWLKKIAVNEWIDHQRKLARQKEEALGATEIVATAETPSIAMDLDQALSALPDETRLCVVLSYHERMTHTEIAALTGLPDGTVKSHIRRGSARLRELLLDYGEHT